MPGSIAGPVFPEGASPGSREWAGCAVLDDDLETVTVYCTAAAVRGEASSEYRQRLVAATGRLPAMATRSRSTPGESIARSSPRTTVGEPADEDEGVSFVDQFDLGGRALEDLEGDGADAVHHHFGGTFAPELHLALDGRRAVLR